MTYVAQRTSNKVTGLTGTVKGKGASLCLMKAGVLLGVFLMLGYPLLPERELLGYYVTRCLVVMLGVAMAVYVSVVSRRDEHLWQFLSKLRVYLYGYIPIVVAVMLWTTVRYNYSIENVLTSFIPYAYVFWAYPLIYIYKQDDDPAKILKIVAILTIGILCLKAYSWYCYNYSGQVVFERLLFEYDEWYRGGNQRVNAGFLVGILLAVTMGGLFSDGKKPIWLATIVGVMLYLSIVSAYRYQLLVSIAACILALYFTSRRSGSGVLLRLAIIVAVGLLITSEFSQSFFETFTSAQSAMSQSTQVRIDNMSHYWNIVVDNGAIFGLGFISSGNSAAASYMTYFGNHIYWLEDIGILGEFFRIGLLAIWTYGYFVYLAIKASSQLIESSQNRGLVVLVLTMAVYALLSCLAMNIFDGQRAFDVPFYLSIFSYVSGLDLGKGEEQTRFNKTSKAVSSEFKRTRLLEKQI